MREVVCLESHRGSFVLSVEHFNHMVLAQVNFKSVPRSVGPTAIAGQSQNIQLCFGSKFVAPEMHNLVNELLKDERFLCFGLCGRRWCR